VCHATRGPANLPALPAPGTAQVAGEFLGIRRCAARRRAGPARGVAVKGRAELRAERRSEFWLRAGHRAGALAQQRSGLDADPGAVHVRRRVRASHEGGHQATLASLELVPRGTF
jgi:hypothetical protein